MLFGTLLLLLLLLAGLGLWLSIVVLVSSIVLLPGRMVILAVADEV